MVFFLQGAQRGLSAVSLCQEKERNNVAVCVLIRVSRLAEPSQCAAKCSSQTQRMLTHSRTEQKHTFKRSTTRKVRLSNSFLLIIGPRMKHGAQCVQMWRLGLTALLGCLGLCLGLSSPSVTVPNHRQHSEFSDFRGTSAGWVQISVKQQLPKSKKVRIQRGESALPCLSSSLHWAKHHTSFSVRLWRMEPNVSGPSSPELCLRCWSGTLWCWTAFLRLMPSRQEKDTRKWCLLFQILLKAPRCCPSSSWNAYSYLLG